MRGQLIICLGFPELCPRRVKAARNYVGERGSGCLPIQLYLQNQAASPRAAVCRPLPDLPLDQRWQGRAEERLGACSGSPQPCRWQTVCLACPQGLSLHSPSAILMAPGVCREDTGAPGFRPLCPRTVQLTLTSPCKPRAWISDRQSHPWFVSTDTSPTSSISSTFVC